MAVQVNLHTHLEGRVRPATAAELAAQAGVAPPEGGWERSLVLDGPSSLTEYLAKVAQSYPLLATPAGLERVAREAVEDSAKSGVDYLELRFGPPIHARGTRGMRDEGRHLRRRPWGGRRMLVRGDRRRSRCGRTAAP